MDGRIEVSRAQLPGPHQKGFQTREVSSQNQHKLKRGSSRSALSGIAPHTMERREERKVVIRLNKYRGREAAGEMLTTSFNLVILI